jgi:hypothetical protein
MVFFGCLRLNRQQAPEGQGTENHEIFRPCHAGISLKVPPCHSRYPVPLFKITPHPEEEHRQKNAPRQAVEKQIDALPIGQFLMPGFFQA